MSEAGPSKKPIIKVNVLHCRSQTCNALIPFEETSEGLLLGNIFPLADVDGDQHFLPCPRCGGRNLVEEVDHGGRRRTRVFGFQEA